MSDRLQKNFEAERDKKTFDERVSERERCYKQASRVATFKLLLQHINWVEFDRPHFNSSLKFHRKNARLWYRVELSFIKCRLYMNQLKSEMDTIKGRLRTYEDSSQMKLF